MTGSTGRWMRADRGGNAWWNLEIQSTVAFGNLNEKKMQEIPKRSGRIYGERHTVTGEWPFITTA